MNFKLREKLYLLETALADVTASLFVYMELGEFGKLPQTKMVELLGKVDQAWSEVEDVLRDEGEEGKEEVRIY